jgi:hypothetical protein
MRPKIEQLATWRNPQSQPKSHIIAPARAARQKVIEGPADQDWPLAEGDRF